MTVMRTLQIDAQWLYKGYFLLWSDPYVQPGHIVGQLFMYHKPSAYGTFIRMERVGPREMIVLPAVWAVDYWRDLPVAKHASCTWSDEAERYKKLAHFVHKALHLDLIIPDFEQWKQGNVGWRIAWHRWYKESTRVNDGNSPEMHSDYSEPNEPTGDLTSDERSFLDRWLSHVLESLLTDPDFADVEYTSQYQYYDRWVHTYEKMSNMHPDDWPDEEEWLLALGQEGERSPFRVSVQLSEPGMEKDWRLSLRLDGKDGEGGRRSILCSFKGEILDGECPPDWEPFIKERISRENRKIIALVNELDQDSSGQVKDRLNDDEAWLFLVQWSPRLIERGISVLLPSWWDRARRAKPRVRARIRSSAPGTSGESVLGLHHLFEFDWQIAIGDELLTEEEYRKIAASNKNLVSLHGNWVVVDQKLLKNIQKKLSRYEREGGIPLVDVLKQRLLMDGVHDFGTYPDGLQPHESEQKDSVSGNLFPDDPLLPLEETNLGEVSFLDLEYGQREETLLNMLRRIEPPPSVPVPKQLKGELRTYQREGLSWLAMLRRLNVGGCLADDMGLGKTVQWIAYLLHVQETGQLNQPSLLVCPTSVLGNWQKEIARFAPGLVIYLHHGPNRHKGEAFIRAAHGAHVVLTSYTLASLDQEELHAVEWDSVCLDEAQNIKNYYTKQAQAIKQITARHRVAMTGTPIENWLTELWSIMNFLNPGYMGSLRSFSSYARMVERERDEEQIARIQTLVRPFLLRREKKDPAIKLNLPVKEEFKCYISLTPEQSALYEQLLDQLFRRIDRMVAMERRGAVLSTIMRLKQLCDHPAMLHRNFQLPMEEMLEQSNKLMRLAEMVEEVREAGERCIIFTQFIDMGHLLQSVLQKQLNEKVMFIHGSIPRSRRDEMIADFQRSAHDTLQPSHQTEECGILVMSLKTGGTGLNLTAANHVFHYDRWWNPAVENQASDRVYRIGQERDVFVHKFITIGTLEERIDDMLEQKIDLSRRIVGTGDRWISELSDDELRDLLELRTV